MKWFESLPLWVQVIVFSGTALGLMLVLGFVFGSRA